MDDDNGSGRTININPRPRIRAIPPPTPQMNKQVAHSPRARSAPVHSPAKRPVEVPDAEPRKKGYGHPPIEHQFKQGNPGGPGRPKGSKSQDAIFRAELLKKETVRKDGKERQVSRRELIPTLMVNRGLEKRDFKSLHQLNEQSRRLFPEQPSEAALIVSDPAADREFLRDLLAMMSMGEADDAAVYPLGDFMAPVFEAGSDEEDDDDWIQGEADLDVGEQSDEDA